MKVTVATSEELAAHCLKRLAEVRANLGLESAVPLDPGARFAELVDSMGMVEFLMLLARDCGVTPARIEDCTAHHFGTVAELAAALTRAGLAPHCQDVSRPETVLPVERSRMERAGQCWLAATAVSLPEAVETGAALSTTLGRPPGWLEEHAGIQQRRVWAEQVPLAAAATAGRRCLESAGLLVDEVGTLLVTSEAPPLLVGLGAALHHGLDLRPTTTVLEIGGACTGFLAALWLGQILVPQQGAVLIVAVEAPSRLLHVEPGPEGEAAALFGDGAAACLLCANAVGSESVAVKQVVLGADGSAGHLIRLETRQPGGFQLHLDGRALAGRAVRAMAQSVRDLATAEQFDVAELAGVVAHGGNGRMPALLARQLDLPAEQVWSTTSATGNLGSASLPIAWHGRQPPPRGRVIWTAAGAGLTWGGALTDSA